MTYPVLGQAGFPVRAEGALRTREPSRVGPLPCALFGLTFATSTARLAVRCIDVGAGMRHHYVTVLCGRLGLIAAFVLIAAVIAAPLLQRAWSPDVMIAQR